MRSKSIFYIVVIIFTLLLVPSALATNYSFDDTGHITNTQIQVNGDWYFRPGLDHTFPLSTSMGPFPVKADLASPTNLTSVVLNHGQPVAGPPWGQVVMTPGLTAEIPELDPADFYYCQPVWRYAFFLQGFEGSIHHEDDERHYANGEGGDPYVIQILNPNPNQEPAADAGGPYEADRWSPVTFDGSGSFDPEGFGLTFEWNVYAGWVGDPDSPFFPDDEFDDGFEGQLELIFDENGEYRVDLRVTDECGASTVSETIVKVYDPHVVVIPQHDHIAAMNWRPGWLLTLSVNDVAIGTLPSVYFNEGDLYGADFPWDFHHLDIAPGDLVTISGDPNPDVVGDEIVRSHVTRDHTISFVDYDTDVVTGTAQPGSYVRVRPSDFEGELVVFADSNGQWQADFSTADPVFDIQPSTEVGVVQQNDDDSSHTLVFYFPPTIHAGLTHNWIELQNFTPGSTAVITINGDPYSVDTDEGGFAWFDANEFEIDLVPGMTITVADGQGLTKTLETADISLDTFDPDNDLLKGTAPPSSTLQVDTGNEFGGYGAEVFTSLDGTWELDLAGEFDIEPNMGAQARLFDEDGDSTVAEPPPPPVLHAVPYHPEIHGHDWPADAWVTLFIDNNDDLGDGYLYSEAKTADHDWCGQPCFDLNGVFDLLPGHVVTMMDDHGHEHVVHVTAIAISAVDLAGDTVSGTADPGAEVWVYPFELWHSPRLVIADASGNWTADFSVRGTGEFEQETLDILPGMGGRAIRFENGYSDDGTLAYWPLGPEFLSADLDPNPVAVGTPAALSALFKGYTFNPMSESPIVSMAFLVEGITDWIEMPTDGGNPVAAGTAEITLSEPGVYPVSVKAVDAAGQEAYAFVGFLVVYDPAGGFVTGGGWIWSPAGAYSADPDLEGRANFGFVAKYKKGANIPDGQTEFQFKAGDLNFQSTNYDWLVVAGYKAMFKGSGTINGAGEYKFMLTTWDGDLKDGDGVDKFRMRIWYVDTAGVEYTVYDNQVDADFQADPSTELLGGSIVIHKSK